MPISSISTNASGRTRDISILHGVDPTGGRHPVTLEFGKVSSFCVGVQKLIQRYVISFLTIVGSQKDYPAFGTSFMAEMQTSSKNASQIDILHTFNFANTAVLTAFKTYQSENTDLPLDEQIDTAILQDINIVGDHVSFDIQIVTLAGDTIEFIVPLPDTK